MKQLFLITLFSLIMTPFLVLGASPDVVISWRLSGDQVEFVADAVDPDGDAIERYAWVIKQGGSTVALNNNRTFKVNLSEGTYSASVTVTDARGEVSTKTDPQVVVVSGSGSSDAVGVLRNPLGSISSIPELLEAILDKVVFVSAAVIIPLFIIYAGFLFITAQGRAEQLEKAKKTLLWTLIGAAIVLGAEVLANILVSSIESIKS